MKRIINETVSNFFKAHEESRLSARPAEAAEQDRSLLSAGASREETAGGPLAMGPLAQLFGKKFSGMGKGKAPAADTLKGGGGTRTEIDYENDKI